MMLVNRGVRQPTTKRMKIESHVAVTSLYTNQATSRGTVHRVSRVITSVKTQKPTLPHTEANTNDSCDMSSLSSCHALSSVTCKEHGVRKSRHVFVTKVRGDSLVGRVGGGTYSSQGAPKQTSIIQ